MSLLGGLSVPMLADASAASGAMRAFVTPAVITLCVLAGLASTLFLAVGGFQYMTSSGKPEKLEQAKKIIRNAMLGLILVLAAGTLTAILSHAYASSAGAMHDKLPTIAPVTPKASNSFGDAMLQGIISLLKAIIESMGQPFIQALGYFTNSTPLMGDNSNVFNLWLAIVGITDVLFIGVVALLGFQVMSFEAIGLTEVDVRQLLPQLVLVFLLINISIFAIDAVISLSNAMIYALKSGFPSTSIWNDLASITKQSTDMGVAGLLVMLAFLILAVMLLVYYLGRLITLYLGAILSPLILMLWLLPAFKDFAVTALKVYLMLIFVLFVHVVILLLAGSLFVGLLNGDANGQPNTLMALLLGLATVVALLKTQGVMRELSYAASAPRAARELGGQFIRGVTAVNTTRRAVYGVATGAYRFFGPKKGTKKGPSNGPDNGNMSGGGIGDEFASQRPNATGDMRKAEGLEAI
jgi:hypothetical protein